jgi:PAS domain S-box-containing protein
MASQDAQQKEPYRRLAEINRAITTSLNFDEVLNLIVKSAAQLVTARATVLLLVDKDGLLRIRAAVGISAELMASFSGRMEEEVIEKLHESLAIAPGESLDSVPVIAKHSLTGLLVVARDHSLNEEEEWQLSALADQAAIALQNARLYEMELAEANRERDETRSALRRSNKRINKILESITDIYYSLDRQWRFIDINRQTEIRLGKSRTELIGKVIWELYPHAVGSPIYEQLHKAMDQSVPVHFEVASKIVPGAWFEAHAYPSKDGLTVYLRDITQRRDAEVTRRELAAIVESSQDAIVSKDLNGTIISWNKGAEHLYGYSANEALGQPVTMLIPADRFDEEPTILDRIRRGESIEHYETIRRHKDGRLLDISLTISPVRDEKGKIVGASKIARDITERKRALEQIRFQARLLDAVEQGVIATDLEGKVLYWNTFAEGMYGWSTKEAVGSRIMDLTPAATSRAKANEIFARLREGLSWSGELLLQRRDGSSFPAMITNSPIVNEKGVLIGIVGVSQDITDLKRTEEERARLLELEQQARAEAEEANRLKDEFLATLSHELRNPLNVVIGYAEILRRGEPQTLEFVTNAAEIIRRNALSQSQLVSDLLDLSRLQMGKLTLTRRPISMATIIRDSIETVEAAALAKQITFDLNITSDALVVDGDPIRLEQIAWNLLNNAVKFTSTGGRVSISLSEDDDCVQLLVEDNGQGILPEFLPHVFEIFRQADAGTARRQGGLGIGLSLVRQLAELHGGRVSAKSAGPGMGASFAVWIPLRKLAIPVAGVTEEKDTTGALKNRSILVIDDSFETTEMLGTLLEMEGAQVETARGGSEALSLAAGRRYDLVISDISMPDMDGYQMLRKLRALPSMDGVPALALTGHGRVSDVERARREGFAAHFTKPLDIDKLLQTVRELTEENTSEDASEQLQVS